MLSLAELSKSFNSETQVGKPQIPCHIDVLTLLPYTKLTSRIIDWAISKAELQPKYPPIQTRHFKQAHWCGSRVGFRENNVWKCARCNRVVGGDQ